LDFIFWSKWQHNAERSPAIRLRLVLDQTAVLLDNAGSNGQAESGAFLFGGEEWIEQSLLHFRGNPLSRIGNVNYNSGDVSSVKNLLVQP
jgi:hypothetical protein